jgi:type IV pilus assembly protein PilM
LLLSGGSSRVDGFDRALADRFDTPVEMFDPFRLIAFEPLKLGDVNPQDVVPTLAVAVGLALRRVGDR